MKINGPKTLTLFLTLLVFFIMLATMIIMLISVFVLLKLGWLSEVYQPTIYTPIIVIMVLSIAIGTTLANVISSFPLKPLRRLIAATEQMAKGNFDVRIRLNYPQELKHLSESFNKMAEELGNTELLRSDFVNNFSHEFKTPIVSLRGFAKILKNPDLSPEERNEYLDIIISEADRLSSLSTNILNLSKIEKLKIAPENQKFDLSEQIRKAILVLENKWSSKNLNMKVNLEEVTFNGNDDLLNQIWINLVDNAIKFSPPAKEVSISLQENKDSIIFEIDNFGPKLKEETKKHLFDKFYQGDTSHTSDGNGIGLAIVKKIVSLYCGSVSVQNKEGSVISFTVALPKI
ncbi:HAMP domain-containing sensor histidine kinase [Sinanaerobacter sp. ZZT-01]|uniref:HAMP domain-containing sensor histidine kinase n=1 Tax=Sinanaerobacter sp. ZZT-01 TaxID=3111540 RepID=UPI002D76E239|nr:HAMP domain-containing sensor histidine kinase [Sinanaerobacter sp. ZZT-01]WRR95124.1 HAMP domain-containing sensor histidine kinase [Sinanaerobacter sp. ZZT-01]